MQRSFNRARRRPLGFHGICGMHNPTRNVASPTSSSPHGTTSKPSLSPTSTGSLKSSSRWFLAIQARVLRFLARLGFYLHSFPRPSPPAPSFIRTYTTAPIHGEGCAASLQLAFYVPADYHREVKRGRKYPVVVNFHGGGFTMGRYSDDARWAAAVVQQVSAVVVGVTYRLAPEHPFPTAIEDGVCALLYLSAHAETLGINPSQISLSGFSAGGNMAFAVPLRLQTYKRAVVDQPDQNRHLPLIASIIAWYPSLDNRLTRSERRARNPKPSKNLPSILTNLFDASYFPVKASVESPYASPAAATQEDLMMALPEDIILYLCEWDMLLQEGKEFAERIEQTGKRVRCEIITERRHGFGKSPWPFGLDWKVGLYYKQACEWLCEVYGRPKRR